MQKLERAKLIIRTMEGKITNVYPTPKAKEWHPKMQACMQQFYREYIRIFGTDESAKLVAVVARAADKLDG
jgi:ribulose bisphosphate carboxylase small subunit